MNKMQIPRKTSYIFKWAKRKGYLYRQNKKIHLLTKQSYINTKNRASEEVITVQIFLVESQIVRVLIIVGHQREERVELRRPPLPGHPRSHHRERRDQGANYHLSEHNNPKNQLSLSPTEALTSLCSIPFAIGRSEPRWCSSNTGLVCRIRWVLPTTMCVCVYICAGRSRRAGLFGLEQELDSSVWWKFAR